MRFFAVFFAVYLLVLACLPCADGTVSQPVRARARVTAQTDAAAHHQQDWCTPLCHCHCCAGTSLPAATAVVLPATHPVGDAARLFARLTSPAPQQRAFAVWQPPQA
ncbi:MULTISPECIES: DUF6660 family protein [Hymenobacter]|uniref:DUF6660 family protein n=1 Tax=Hymenobacter TaxID=89966 RepID=UPI001114F635|nr:MULTISPECIES: DUF6660 family protein [Hymenobacter]QNE42100.1 hypothetical protein F1C16_20980 [Hymenobacter sp. NBH84]